MHIGGNLGNSTIKDEPSLEYELSTQSLNSTPRRISINKSDCESIDKDPHVQHSALKTRLTKDISQ
jgi:hypothetical protein